MFVVGGESLIDLKAEVVLPDGSAVGRDGENQIVMTAHPGGSPYNCAIALARLGNRTGFMCPISRDAFGDYLLSPLADAGVEVLLRERVADFTTLAVVNFDANNNARYGFYRAADRAITTQVALAALPDEVKLFQIGGFCAIDEPQAGTWLELAKEAIARGATISIDPNVRPSLIGDFDAYRARLDRFLDLAQIIKVSEEDLEALAPGLDLETHARRMLARPRCALVVVTLGEKGSLAFSEADMARAGIYSPPVFGDTVGAGDSLMAGILSWLDEHGHLDGEGLVRLRTGDLAAMLHFGAVVAGINCGRTGCKPPSRAEVDAVLGAR